MTLRVRPWTRNESSDTLLSYSEPSPSPLLKKFFNLRPHGNHITTGIWIVLNVCPDPLTSPSCQTSPFKSQHAEKVCGRGCRVAEQGWTDRRQAKSKRGPDTKEAEQGSQGKAARRSTGRSSDRTRHGRLGAGLGQISNAVFLSHYS